MVTTNPTRLSFHTAAALQRYTDDHRLVNLLTGEWTVLPDGQDPELWLDEERYLFRLTGNVQELWLGDRAGNQFMILQANGYLVHYWPWPDATALPISNGSTNAMR